MVSIGGWRDCERSCAASFCASITSRGFEACWEIPANEATAIHGHWCPVPGRTTLIVCAKSSAPCRWWPRIWATSRRCMPCGGDLVCPACAYCNLPSMAVPTILCTLTHRTRWCMQARTTTTPRARGSNGLNHHPIAGGQLLLGYPTKVMPQPLIRARHWL